MEEQEMEEAPITKRSHEVSLDWVLGQLAGRSFPDKGHAHDFIQETAASCLDKKTSRKHNRTMNTNRVFLGTLSVLGLMIVACVYTAGSALSTMRAMESVESKQLSSALQPFTGFEAAPAARASQLVFTASEPQAEVVEVRETIIVVSPRHRLPSRHRPLTLDDMELK